jgi:hypothetical protein
MPQAHGVALPPLLAKSLRAALLFLPVILLPEAAMSQTIADCPNFDPKAVILKNQPYALCAARPGAVNYAGITYANCQRLRGNSISIAHDFLSAPGSTGPGNIATVNQGQPAKGGYIVSTYSVPAGATNRAGNLAVYQCERGSYAQCDGGLCSTSTSGKDSPLWGHVNTNEIICSCGIETTNIPFQVMGPKPCPTTAAEFDAVCGLNVSKANNGANIFIGLDGTDGFHKASECLVGHPVTLNECTRPAH